MMDRNSMIDWIRDHTVSGWRSRVFLSNTEELIAYDDGRWEVRLNGETKAFGKESCSEHAKLRALHVHAPLVFKYAPR